MMKLRLLFPMLLFALFYSFMVSAQQRCYSTEHLIEQMRANPEFAEKVIASERNVDNYISRRDLQGRSSRINIPVIVHVLYRSSSEKISRAQIESQINVLSEDFDATNSDFNKYDAGYSSVKGDANINFCLAQVRWVKTKKRSFTTNDDMKKTDRGGDDPIDPSKYLNIWVCSIGQGILGYAQFPGGPASTDGVVINYLSFGKDPSYNLYSAYDLGRTATHEVGHWLGLRHIWGDATCGNDFVGDTPLHNSSNYGCPGTGHQSTCTGTPLEMWMNYMDYTDDRCMYLFSAGQVTRMNSFLDGNSRLLSISTLQDCSILPDYDSESGSGGGGGGGTPGGGNGNGNGHGNPHGKLIVGDFMIYPTISSGTINLEISAVNTGLAQFKVYNQVGVVVFANSISVDKGINTTKLNLDKLPGGLYIVQLIQGTNSLSKKILIQ